MASAFFENMFHYNNRSEKNWASGKHGNQVMEMWEWKREQKGMPKMEVKTLDWAAYHSIIVLSSSQAQGESCYTSLSSSSSPSWTG